jgi:hypothetical protein
VKASIALCLAAYTPHILEEHWTKMYDDPLIVSALSPFAALSARASSYLVFQASVFVALAAVSIASLGGRFRDAVVGALALAMLAELHHPIRALASGHYNSGLFTALPVVFVGALVLRDIFERSRIPARA